MFLQCFPEVCQVVFKFCFLRVSMVIIVVQMDAALMVITCVQWLAKTDPIIIVPGDMAGTAVLKCPPFLIDEAAVQRGEALRHDHKAVSALVHEPDVIRAEIAAVQDDTDPFITVSSGFFQHVLQLRRIVDAAQIVLIKQRFSVLHIIRDGQVEDGVSAVDLWMPVFYHLNVPGLVVFVRGVIGDIYPVILIVLCIPVIKKSCDLILRDPFQKIGDVGIAVDMHLRIKERMVKRVIRIVLSDIALGDDGVGSQVQYQRSVFLVEIFQEVILHLQFLRDPLQDNVCAGPQTAAAF